MIGETVTFTVTVSGVATPSGTVTLKEGATGLGSKDLAVEGTTTVTFDVATLSVGSHPITAEYGGDVGNGYDPSTSAPVTQTVNKRTTSTTATGDSTGVVNQTLTFNVQVNDTSGAGASPSFNGSANLVTWTVSGAASATLHGTVDSTGAGTITYTPPVTGSYTITAHYEGNESYLASASDGSQAFDVDPRTTSTTVTGDSAGVVNQTLTFNVQVNDTSGAGGTSPSFNGSADLVTWTVTLPDFSTTTMTGTVDSTGQGTVTYTPAVTGSFSIEAHYEGNASYAESTAPDGSQAFTVEKRTTSTTVGGPASASVNQELTFTVQVNDTSGAGGTSPSFDGTVDQVTWTVTLPDTSTTTITGDVDALGTGSVAYTPTTTGSYSISAEYVGNDDYEASEPDGSKAFTVEKRTTSTTVTGPFSGYVDQELTFNIQVNDTSGAGGTSPGFDTATDQVTWTVTLPDTSTTTITGDVDDTGAGSVTYTPTVYGSYSISAHYEGNDYYAESASDGSKAFTVDKRTTSTTTTGPSTGYLNQELTFDVQVNDTSGAGGTSPSFDGTVDQVTWTVNEPGGGTTTITGDVIADGTGSVNYTPTALGSYTIRAHYEGNDDYAESDPDNLKSFDVIKRPTSTDGGVAGPASGYVNEPLTFNLTVSDTSGVTPALDFDSSPNLATWTVSGVENATLQGTVASDGTGSTGFTPAVVGSHTIAAHYEGNGNYEASSPDGDQAFTVNQRTTTATISVPSGTPTGYVGEPLTFTIAVTDDQSGTGTSPDLDGVVTWTVEKGGGGVTGSPFTESVDSNGDGTLTYTPTASGSDFTIEATYAGNTYYIGSSDGPEAFTVDKRTTSTDLSCPTEPIPVNQPYTFFVQVSDTSGASGSPDFRDDPAGGELSWTVTYDPGGAGEDITTASGDVDASGFGYVEITPPLVGSYRVEVTYEGNAAYASSTATACDFTVEAAGTPTLTTLMCSETPLVVGDQTYCTATVTELDGTPVTSGTVYFSRIPASGGNFDTSSLALDGAGRATVTYTATSGDTTPHAIWAHYAGSGAFDPSEDDFAQEVVKRAADIHMSIAPTSAYVFQPVTISIHVEDDTTEGTASVPTGDVTLTTDGAGTFDHADGIYTLDGNGDCTATYTPGALVSPFDDPTKTITATYDGSSVHTGKSAVGHLTVNLRPTTTTVKFASSESILVREVTSFTVTVEDAAGVAGTVPAPQGTIGITKSLEPKSEGNISLLVGPVLGSGKTSWVYTYYRSALDSEGGDFDQLDCTYTPDDGVHTGSVGSYGKSISRRPTITTITNAEATATGIEYDIEVDEDPGNAGTYATPAGQFIEKGGTTLDETVIAAVPPLSQTDVAKILPAEEQGTTLMVNVTVHYKPTDRIHVPSLDSVTVDRSDYIEEEPPTDPSNDGSDCHDGCGDGGTNIEQMIFNMNAAIVALHATQMGLDAAATIASLFPDPVWTTGIVFESGTEIPAKDIVIAVLEGANQLLEVAIVAMETDLDGDGIPDTVEETVTFTDYNNFDTDGDGMDDHDEIDNAGGYYGGTRRPNPNEWDSDGDGLGDGDEADNVGTSFCVQDTDCDGATDYEEYTTFADYDSNTKGSTTARGDTRDHCEPLAPDTDGDGLDDSTEYLSGKVDGVTTSTPASTTDGDGGYSPYVNDNDSDGDGILDGNESTNGDAIWDYTQIGGTGTTGSGETHLCMADTDGDGLLDGEEEALFGRGAIEVHSTLGTITTPALDDDSDDDGLSDYEEQVVTQTDPLNWDSDGDTLSDANEVIATGGAWPARTFTQVSDPLDPDTDDDELPDNLEYNGTGLGTSQGLGGEDDNECPYVNDDDSDDDGLQDGTEDADRDGQWDSLTMADSTTQNPIGETNLCDPDTDGDGLTDGEEVALFGGLPISATFPYHLQAVMTTAGPTIPALDDDSDNDGLSDYEEVEIAQTDALDSDTDDDNISDANELIATGTWPKRQLYQESDPLDPDTDDDYLPDDMEYKGTAFEGTGLGISRTAGGTPDNICPYVNDDDSDDDGLQDGVEDANKDGTYGVNGAGMNTGGIGSTPGYPNKNGAPYWETDLCDPDTDDDGLLDGEEVGLIGGEPLSGRPGPGETFTPVLFQAVSTQLPLGTTTVPAGYTHAAPSPGTGNDLIAPYTFTPQPGATTTETIPALDVDSDDDGLSDYEEVNITGTAPLDQDTDNDTLMDSDEVIATSNTSGDPDHPRRTFDLESDPLDINTDDDDLFDPQEYGGSGLSGMNGGVGGARDAECPLVNNDDSDGDGIQDGAVVTITPAGVITSTGAQYTYTHYEDFIDLEAADEAHPGTVRTVATPGYGEQQNDGLFDVCDPDSDGDGLNDGEEIAIGTNPDDWDTDDDGRNDWHEQTGGGPIPTDPFDPDTDDDGLLDSAEVFGSNPTNPVNADTDGDGLCDGGTGTPWMLSGDGRIEINPICKSCSDVTDVGLDACGTSVRTGSVDGIGDHPNPHGYGEDKNGNGTWEPGGYDYWGDVYAGDETDPNQFDTDGDADGDGVEVLGFSTSRQGWIPVLDLFDRPINVTYPDCGCMDPLDPDTDDDQLEDGYEDRNHDGNFDFLPSEFDHYDPLPGPPIPYPTETNPCDADTDDDELTDYEERYQAQVFEFYANWDNDGDGLYNEDPFVDGIDEDGDGLDGEDPVEPPFNPTNPLDHDTDNDWILDGPEVFWECVELAYWTLDNDSDGLTDEDPIDGIDNDEDGLIDEDPVDYWIRFVPMLDPTNRDSDSDGWIDGLDEDPCNSELIPLLAPVQAEPIDTDGDGFSDDDELLACTHPNDPDDHPIAYGMMNLDLDDCFDDRLWLEPAVCCGIANSVVIDVDSNMLIDVRVQIVQPRDVRVGDFDGDGHEDDARYVIEYAFAMYRVVQHRIVATIDDFDMDLVIDAVSLEQK